MRIKKLLRFAIAMVAGGIVVAGCVDENYDLSNIDGTAEFQVKDLVLPINIDEIEMQQFIGIEDTGHIRVINGEYVLIDSGQYESDEIIMPDVVAKAPKFDPIYSQIKLVGGKSFKDYPDIPQIPNTPSFPLRFDIGKQMSGFSYQAAGVSDFIVSVDTIYANFEITIDLTVEGLDNSIKSWTMEDLIIQLPKGLVGRTSLNGIPDVGDYNSENGEVIIGSQKIDGMTAQFKMSVTEVDMAQAGAIFENHSFSLTDSLGIRAGQVAVNEADVIDVQSLIQKEVANFKVQFAMEDIDIESFAGEIQYSIDGFDIADVPITGIPTILSQDETDISLVNPQIYLCFSNPLGANFELYAQTGLTLTAKREGQPDKVCSVDTIKLACPGCQGCQFCLSPIDPGQGNYWGKFVNAQYIPFTSLAEVLSGNGLPDKIGISLNKPHIPVTKVKGFPLGENFRKNFRENRKMTGCYTLFAPLQLKEGSKIVYSNTQRGWWTEELDKLSIGLLQIDALITNDLPVDIVLSCCPIDKDGNDIKGVTIGDAHEHFDDIDIKDQHIHLESGVTDAPLHISITGNIEHLDGIRFMAYVKATGQTLRPDEHIILKDIKVKVSGNYTSK